MEGGELARKSWALPPPLVNRRSLKLVGPPDVRHRRRARKEPKKNNNNKRAALCFVWPTVSMCCTGGTLPTVTQLPRLLDGDDVKTSGLARASQPGRYIRATLSSDWLLVA